MKKKTICAFAGALSGAVNGLFGAGGGLVLVPMLIRGAGLSAEQALPTSVAAVLPMCAISAIRYLSDGGVGFGALLPYLTGGLAGGIIAGLTFYKVPAVWLRRALGIFIVYAGVRMVLLI